MTDNLSPEDRRKTMRAVKGKGTALERKLWAMLAGMGLRGWKKNDASVCGKPDVVFPVQLVAIFVDGCFWHGCPTCDRPLPKTNADYWIRKIRRNVERANSHGEELRRDGWTVVRIWEHEMADTRPVRTRIVEALEGKEKQCEHGCH